MRLRPIGALLLSGISWLAIGIFLLSKGLRFLVELAQPGRSSPIINSLKGAVGGKEQAVLVFICLGLFIGFIKGRFVLSKTVGRLAARFHSYGGAIPLSKVYPVSYLVLISSMVLLGVSLKYIPFPQEIRGTVDVAIGSALTNGAFLYFRHAFTKGKAAVK